MNERYNHSEKMMIESVFNKIARATRKSGKISESRKEKIIKEWDKYDKSAVISAIEAYMKMNIEQSERGKGKNEKYLGGIMKNKQREIDNADVKRCNNADEERKLSEIAEEYGSEERNCDF